MRERSCSPCPKIVERDGGARGAAARRSGWSEALAIIVDQRALGDLELERRGRDTETARTLLAARRRANGSASSDGRQIDRDPDLAGLPAAAKALQRAAGVGQHVACQGAPLFAAGARSAAGIPARARSRRARGMTPADQCLQADDLLGSPDRLGSDTRPRIAVRRSL